MKVIFWTNIFILLANFVSGQDAIGKREEEIRFELPNKHFDTGYTFDNKKWISWKNETIQCSYFFDKNQICNLFTLQAINRVILKNIGKEYNLKYTLINDSVWKSYRNNDIITITLDRAKNGERYFSFTSKNYPLKQEDTNPSINSQADTLLESDSIIGSFYQNKKHKFRIHFIDNWVIDKGGPFDKITIRSYQPDSGKTITIVVIEYPGTILKDKAISEKYKDEFIAALKVKGIVPTNFKIGKGWLNNFPANILTYNIIIRNDIYEIPYTLKQICCAKNGKMYTISCAMPTLYYTEEEEYRISEIIYSFNFE